MFTTRSKLLKKRYRKSYIFKMFATTSVLFCLAILLTFIISIVKSAFAPLHTIEVLYNKSTQQFIQNNLDHKGLHNYFPRSLKHSGKEQNEIWYPITYEFKKYITKGKLYNPDLKNDYDKLQVYLDKNNKLRNKFNWRFFAHGDSIYTEMSGVYASVIGSVYLLIVFLLFTIPIGVFVGIYIAEFIPVGKWKSGLQVNIQNLASIPSIIYGIITLNIFINGLHLTRSSILVGGIALSLLIFPMIVMITYNAVSMVPQSYKDSALALGLSKVQTTFIVTLPIAVPRILTGILLATARAAGETAPLIIIGMAFFSTNAPSSIINDASTTLPLQIYLWISNPKEAFIEHASAAILVFIIFLTTVNLLIHFIRKRLTVM